LLCSVLAISSYHLWRRYSDQILGQPHYKLDPDCLVVTAQPEWIRSDVAANAVTYGRLGGASLLDPELVLQVRQAFGVQPWVKRVKRVNKRYPNTVEVDLEYRRPVAMVVVPRGMFPGCDYEGLLPVDEEGYLLPVEVNQEEATGYPKISGIDSLPCGESGSPWGDRRVAQAAQIVARIDGLWEPLQLYQVEVPPQAALTESPVDETFFLITQKRRRIPWGRPPGQERHGEQTAAEKVAGLKRFLDEHGPLDAYAPDEHAPSADSSNARHAGRICDLIGR
jgi:hypothetical protein